MAVKVAKQSKIVSELVVAVNVTTNWYTTLHVHSLSNRVQHQYEYCILLLFNISQGL